jgi:transposase
MDLADENASLRAENATLRAELTRVQAQVTTLQQQVAELTARLPPPPGPRPAPRAPAPADKPPRAKRAAAHNHGRPRATPTEVRTHAYDACPTCAYPLQGQSVARRREVLDLPPPQPITVIEFQVLKRYCPACALWYEPPLDLTGLVIGQHRVSHRLMTLIAWLRTVLRLPVRAIRSYLHALHRLDLSVGEIVAVLHCVAEQGQPTVAAIKAELQTSAVLHMDETVWDENGQGGYSWVMTNPAGVSYYHYDHSRAGAVARSLSGAQYRGTLITDFYAAYNDHACRHQRCWAHLLRDLAALEEQPEVPAEVQAWVEAVRDLYRVGRAVNERGTPVSGAERERVAADLRRRVHELGLRWAQAKGHPARALGQRLLRHEGELFEYVRCVGVEATNNRAERAIRPLAVARKISGGTRSPPGSRTRMALQTLFTTWAAKGLEPLGACATMLRGEIPLPSS